MHKSVGELMLSSEERGHRSREQAAVMKFCRIIGRAFHPTFILEETIQKEYVKNFWRQGGNVKDILDKTYARALEKHLRSGSKGPLPNQMTFRQDYGRYILRWVSQKGKIVITLFVYKGKRAPRIMIRGGYKHLVRQKAFAAGIPEIKSNKQGWRSLRAIEVRAVSEPRKLEDLLDVKVPLGDLLDFLSKYK